MHAAVPGGYAGLVTQLSSYVRARPQQAAEILWQLTLADDSEPNMNAITAAGAIPLLVQLLKPNQPAVQIPAAGALSNLALHSECSRDVIVAAGAVPLLAALFWSNRPAVKQQALGVLYNLVTGSRQDSNAIVAALLVSSTMGSDWAACAECIRCVFPDAN